MLWLWRKIDAHTAFRGERVKTGVERCGGFTMVSWGRTWKWQTVWLTACLNAAWVAAGEGLLTSTAAFTFGVLELNFQGFFANHFSVECGYCGPSFVAFHFDETKTLTFAAENISRKFNGADFAEFGEHFRHGFFCWIHWQAADKHFFQFNLPLIAVYLFFRWRIRLGGIPLEMPIEPNSYPVRRWTQTVSAAIAWWHRCYGRERRDSDRNAGLLRKRAIPDRHELTADELQQHNWEGIVLDLSLLTPAERVYSDERDGLSW